MNKQTLPKKMPSRRRRFTDSSSSENSPPSHSVSRRRLPSPPPIGILRNSRHVTIMDPKSITRRVERIADNLEDTSRNLENVDTRLSDYKDLHTDSMSALSKVCMYMYYPVYGFSHNKLLPFIYI